MSTILDALRKLQRDRAAQSPGKDLRGSITSETPFSRARPRSGASRWAVVSLLFLALGGGGYWLYRSGKVDALLGRASSADGVASVPAVDDAQGEEAEEADVPVSQQLAELDLVQRKLLEREAAEARSQPAPVTGEPATQPAIAPTERAAAPPPVAADTPEMAAERARLEAALANARAAHAAQRQAELDAAAEEAAGDAEPPPQVPASAPPVAMPEQPPSAPSPVAVVAPKPKPVAKAVAPAPKKAAAAPAPRRPPERAAEPALPSSAFPAVRVDSIRWHPVPERRIASLRFDKQNAPEAREGDIVSGVLVYRIDPGAVELRVGSMQRTVAPEP